MVDYVAYYVFIPKVSVQVIKTRMASCIGVSLAQALLFIVSFIADVHS